MHEQSTQRWLLTGGSGRIGRMLLRHWQKEPPSAELVVQTRHAEEGLLWDPLRGPLPSKAGKITCLIAFAGVTPATGISLDGNSDLAYASLAAAHAAGIKRVLLSSSSSVYGVAHGRAAIAESAALRPMNKYGCSKVAMEEICAPWRARGLEICCLRIGNVAGADVLLLNGLSASAEKPLRIDCFADGRGPLRSYIGPATLARVIETLASYPKPLPEALNIAAPRPVYMDDLAAAASIPFNKEPAPEIAVQYITLDLRRLATLHNFVASDSTPAEMIRQWVSVQDVQ